MSLLAIIPARAGSQRLKGKNKKDFMGAPLIERTLFPAILCQNKGIITKIVLTTDDLDIINYTKQKYDNDVTIIKRPPELAGPEALTEDVVKHVLKEEKGYYNEFILLQPTSPLRDITDIQFFCMAYKYYHTKSLMSVGYKTNEPNGAIYIRDTKNFLQTGKIITTQTKRLPLRGNGVKDIDIDLLEDLEKAESRYRRYVTRTVGKTKSR